MQTDIFYTFLLQLHVCTVYATFVVPIVVAINKIDKPEADVVSIVDRSSGR